jgi:hypothetical protein
MNGKTISQAMLEAARDAKLDKHTIATIKALTSPASSKPKADPYLQLGRMTDNEKAVLAEIPPGNEYCVGYRYLTGMNDLSKAQLKPIIARLKDMGFIEFHRGLMTEDGEVAGSGWCRTVEGNRYVDRHKL